MCLLVCVGGSAFAQDEGEFTAKKRLMPTVGPGLRAVKRGADGNYYVLTAPGTSAAEFDAAGKLLRRIPAYDEKSPGPQSQELRAVTFGEDMDVDAQGTIYVADRGANAVKIWSAKGDARMVRVNSPVAVAVLPEGEFAVSTLHEPNLVIVYDKNGRDVREFGEPEPISERPELNRFMNIGILVSDGGHLFYGFPYLPEATVREYDRFGYAGTDFQYTGIDAWPAAQATRREIVKQEKRGEAPVFKRILTGVGTEPGSGEVWMALGNNLLHFDKEGNRRGTYSLYTPEGARLEANTILVEQERLIIGSDPLGVYEFEKPKKILNNK